MKVQRTASTRKREKQKNKKLTEFTYSNCQPPRCNCEINHYIQQQLPALPPPTLQLHLCFNNPTSTLVYFSILILTSIDGNGNDNGDVLAKHRASVDTARSYQYKHKSRAERSSVTDISFFKSRNPTPHNEHAPQSNSVRSMKNLDTAPSRSTRRPPVRIDAQEGPWSISVAETPHDARSILYLHKDPPTHNLTLTRNATEVVELHAKLEDSDGAPKLPKLPIDVASLPAPPAKRKSTFLNTLSRLASPSANRVGRQMSGRAPSNPNFGAPAAQETTPIASPSQEIGDPFMPLPCSSANDLESVRAERAIKRVRSDLAAHSSPTTTGLSTRASSTNVSSSNVSSEVTDGVESINGTVEEEIVLHDLAKGDLREEGIREEEEEEADSQASKLDVEPMQPTKAHIPDQEVTDSLSADEAKAALEQIDTSTVTNGTPEEQDTALPTPVADVPASRVPRSHSADPDKASRLSRVYTSSTLQDGTSSATGDESSISTTAGRRSCKKRSQSTDPHRKKKSQRKVAVDDFEMMRVLGKGCAGKVLLVRHKMSSDLYALKAITKRHVLAHQELQHTLTEQAVLKRMSKEAKDPFVVKLWWSFHDKENLFLVMDFHPGGDLATQLARWGRLGRDRARFYAAEIVEGVEGLHAAGVIYRDLKPENILIGADGHIVLTDFGLSKEFPRRASPTTAPPTPTGMRGEFYSTPSAEPATPPWMKGEKGQEVSVGWAGQGVGSTDTTTTFCGTAEYLAPEVDWWSFGTMLYEMLTGITPFWANNHSDMYVRVLQDELQFPEDRAMDQDTKSLIRGLLQRNPALRMCEPRIKKHPYFSMIDWSHVYYKRYIPPYIPPIDPSNASDTQNFDDTFLDMAPIIDDPNDQDQTDTEQDRDQTDAEPTDGEDAYPTPSHSRSPSLRPDESIDCGRYSVIIDDEGDVSGDSGEEETDDEDVPSVITDMIDSPSEQAEAGAVVAESPVVDEGAEAEPKTPEARPQALPEDVHVPAQEKVTALVEPAPPVEVSSALQTSKETPAPVVPASPAKEAAPPLPAKDSKSKTAKVTTSSKATVRNTRGRREKSGVAALDRFLSDGPDEDGDLTEKEDEDDDWDFIEADGEDRNGVKGTSLFARGVVDRYRLAVFRKASTPGGRSFSGLSKESDTHAGDPIESPSPSEKRRGRAPGALTFRKHPRQFLKGKSPPSSFSAKSTSTLKTSTPSTAATTVSSTSSNGLLTPSVSAASTMAMSPSLRSKESATSVGDLSQSSDQSNGETTELPGSHPASPQARKASSPPHVEEPEKLKLKKLKKYKENAEKVLSLFASQRQS
ncbi:hypothetical protein BU15DRAFT_89699 [Melanogaster broomeanus]|nr:hypothetical protein BU15DRAFT_89699 [Melanogaster broomeanus]